MYATDATGWLKDGETFSAISDLHSARIAENGIRKRKAKR